MKKILFSGFVVFVGLGFVGESLASTLYVDANALNPVAPFSSWGTAATNIQDAVDAAVNGDTVSVTNGYYLLTSEITVTNNITVQGITGPEATLVDGGGVNRCFNLGGNDCLITGLTITNGYSSANGGGVLCDDIIPVVSNCVFIGNSARGGGGMRFGTANNCAFVGNFSGGGGGMYEGVANHCIFSGNSVAYDGDPLSGNGGGMHSGTANYCEFIGNSANSEVNASIGNGGGLFNGMANYCEFIGNSAVYGGGMYSIGNGIVSTVSNSTFIGNSAKKNGGGAGGQYSQNMTLFNCVLSGNTARSGGGIYFGIANNCTITGNSADFGGGMIVHNTAGAANNCIVWGNLAGERNDLSFSGNVTVGIVASHTCSPDVEHGVDGNITNAPILVSASHISTNSPCRGAGSATYATGTDVDGAAWLNPPSIGCDEIHGAVMGPITLSFSGPAHIADEFEGEYLVDIRGAVTGNLLDFGDGTLITNAILSTHAWDTPGVYNMILTAFNDDHLNGVSFTQSVQVVSADATAVYVSDATGGDANDGFGWATAKESIQSGVDAQIVHGGIVWVSNGTYAITSEIMVTTDISIQGVNGSDVTVVDGGGSNRCFNLGSHCLISGFTITNGYSAGNGGGIYCATMAPVASNCTISGNSVGGNGGGIYGGRANSCIIIGNSANPNGYGFAEGNGGGMYAVTATACTIKNNSAKSGGGMCYGTANNCLISDNSANNDGGGMYSGEANSCTITANSANNSGGGYFNSDFRTQLRLRNCIVWGNLLSGTTNDIDTFAVPYNSCASDITPIENGNITNVPAFVDAANGDYHLQSNSPCINWGGNPYVSGATDLDGNLRIIEGYVDMGCYEYQGLIGEADNDGDGMSDAWERQWFGINILPEDNADSDVSSNGGEYVAGTDPTNGASYFVAANTVAEVNGTNYFVVEWISIPDRLYSVQWSTNLVSGFQTLETNIEHPQNSYTDTTHNAESEGFYQVDVRLE